MHFRPYLRTHTQSEFLFGIRKTKCKIKKIIHTQNYYADVFYFYFTRIRGKLHSNYLLLLLAFFQFYYLPTVCNLKILPNLKCGFLQPASPAMLLLMEYLKCNPSSVVYILLHIMIVYILYAPFKSERENFSGYP